MGHESDYPSSTYFKNAIMKRMIQCGTRNGHWECSVFSKVFLKSSQIPGTGNVVTLLIQLLLIVLSRIYKTEWHTCSSQNKNFVKKNHVL